LHLTKTDNQNIKADTIFCGDKGIIIILRNGDYETLWDKEKNNWMTQVNTQLGVRITLNLPWYFNYKIDSVCTITAGNKEILPFEEKKGKIIIKESEVKIAKPILIKFKEE